MTRDEAIYVLNKLLEKVKASQNKTNILVKEKQALEFAIEALKEERPHGKWDGEPKQKNMATRICTSCGARGAVGYFCMWCGANTKEGETE